MNSQKQLRRLPIILFVFLLFAILIRLTIRDRLPIVAVAYYATPPAVIAVLACISAYGIGRQKRRTLAWIACILAFISIMWWYRSSFHRESIADGSPSIRVISWNISRGGLSWDGIIDYVNSCNADV